MKPLKTKKVYPDKKKNKYFEKWIQYVNKYNKKIGNDR
jgi:hypothetical protein